MTPTTCSPLNQANAAMTQSLTFSFTLLVWPPLAWRMLLLAVLAVGTVPARGAETVAVENNALPTAVALNYCRASFHRIRKDPTNEVLIQEQEKILNNLNLAQLEDPEVILLYTSVLDEIGQIGITEKEKELYKNHHSSTIRRQLVWDALAFGTDLATGQFGSAVRTGANSWWDYRAKAFSRDNDALKIDKARMTAVVQRSSQFLDTFWKMARKKNIPDRWLVRGDDLDQLDAAMQEQNAEVRLRILRRMEPFMQAYPPYWYYLARTHQELGQLTEAMQGYSHLEKLGGGHFRKDDMLSTAMANQAAIADYLGQDTAIASARKALEYSTDVWEANLIAARILQRHGRIADAEDAILRNIDVKLEEHRSHVFLASLYYFDRNETKLAALLNRPDAVAYLPAPVLLRCATLIGPEKTPPAVMRNIMASLEAYPRMTFGPDQLVVRVGHAWQLHLAGLEVLHDGRPLSNPQVIAGRGFHDLRYAGNLDRGRPAPYATTRGEITMKLTYPDETIVTLVLRDPTTTAGERSTVSLTGTTPLRISEVQIGSETIALRSREASSPDSAPVEVRASRPVTPEYQIPLPPLDEES